MRQVQVFKWIQEKDADGKLQNVRIQDGVATFHQFGAAYEEFENGAGSYAIALIERADGSVQQVNADMIQFAPLPAADSSVDSKALPTAVMLRDHFATSAMAPMVAHRVTGHVSYGNEQDIAKRSYEIADAMLEARTA